ncbi:MAG: DUF2279 domain-containing protein [Saprospiraceae bacterium]
MQNFAKQIGNYLNNKKLTIIMLSFGFVLSAFAQKKTAVFSFKAADSLNRSRCWVLGGVSVGAFAASTYWLHSAWYKQYDRSKFQFFNDNNEWMQMDKLGHVVSAYYESRWASQMYRWAGVSPRKSDWIGVGYSMLIQTSLEIADGFSEKWGFSKGDYLANLAGTGIFIGQQLAWNEQRFSFKVSSTPKKYPSTLIYSSDNQFSIPLNERAYSLLGNNYAISFAKDYNEQTQWLSVNVASFLPKDTRFPKWLNVAVGYSLENAFVGENSYSWFQSYPTKGIPAGTVFTIDKNMFPRYRQFLFSLDLDMTKIHTKYRFLNAILHTFNVIKIPAPALEFNTLGKMKVHPFYF